MKVLSYSSSCLPVACTRGQTLPNGYQCGFKRFSGNGVDVSSNEPCQPKWDRTAQAQGFTFHEHSVILFAESPIRIQTPEKSTVLTRLIRDFDNPRRYASTRCVLRVVTVVHGCVICVVSNGDDICSHESQVHIKRVAVSLVEL